MKKTERSRSALLAVSLGGSLLAVILALLLVNVIRGGRQASGSGGEDTPYPYRWAEKRDGTLSVTLSAPPEGYAWSADFGADAETVAAEQTKPGAFILAPLRENPATVTFTLAHEDDAADRLAALELGVSVETRGNRLKVTAALDELTVLPGMLRGGDELGCPYRIWNEGPRLIVFLTDGAEDPDWAVHIADRRVAAASWQETADGGWRAAFLAGETGETTLTLLSGAQSLRLTLAVASDGEALSVDSHELTRLDGDAGRAAAELAAGTLNVPEGAADVAYDALPLGERGEAAAVRFTLDGWSWSIFAAEDGALYERFAGDYDAAGTIYVFVDERDVAIAPAAQGAYLWWTDDAGRCVVLRGVSDAEDAADEASDPAVLLDMARRVMDAQ